jgi:two-component system, LytTR family, sensor kinase
MTKTETLDPPGSTNRRRYPLIVLGWTAIALIVALILRAQERLPFVIAFVSATVNYYTLGILVWTVCRLNVRLQLWQRRPVRAFTAHAILAVAALAAWGLIQVAFMRATVGPTFWERVYAETWRFQVLTGATMYAATLGVGLTVQSFDRERARQRREAVLEVMARHAELAAIKGQLRPHFLMNALNSILVLIEHDPGQAKAMVTRLASLLHSVFDRLDEPFVLLERELDTIRDYLEIECIRFGDRLGFRIDVTADARAVSLPPFLLQPIVENAVKHGVEPHVRPGHVEVAAGLSGSRLHVMVSDTGNGLAGTSTSGTGRGLELTRRRLDAVYGDGAASLRMERRTDRFVVTLDLPLSADGH